MEQFMTAKGTTLYYDSSYSKGGVNPFTGVNTPRGYYVDVQRNPRKVRAFTDITNDYGATRMFMFEVGRQSKKQAQKAKEMAKGKALEIAERFDV